jgi:hypothetical protein
MVEFALLRELRLDHRTRRPCRACDHLRQPVIGLRPHHDIDERRAGDDLRPLGLRHAAGDGEDHTRSRLLDRSQPAELGEHLLRRVLADMAGVEDHHVGVLRTVRGRVAERRQHVLHPGAVIDIHLTAPGDDVQPALRPRGGGRRRTGHHTGDMPA